MSGRPDDGGADIPEDDWVEQDLLTRALATDRLAQLEADTRAELAAEEGDPAAAALLRRRLAAIEASRANIARS
ncbi:hypothetical protein [Cryptosporangium minutisporangium]|uniref:Uncharacterized protein n=1 Tax=Cryptosporangium minutisporangium TaxID=113569 RepID=A0ABP6SSE9_9ACTN